MLGDEVLAAAVARHRHCRSTSCSSPATCCRSLLVWAALVLIGRSTYRTPWLTVALAAAFTLRHRDPAAPAPTRSSRTSTRACWRSASARWRIAALLRRRYWTAVALVGVGAVVHVTTALWFAVLIGVALGDPRSAGCAASPLVARQRPRPRSLAWALVAGPLTASLTRHGRAWLEAVAARTRCSPRMAGCGRGRRTSALLAVLWWAHRRRQARGVADRRGCRQLVWGATALVAVFLVTLPASSRDVALPVQLQISRVFWLVDFVALVYVDRAASAATRGNDRRRGCSCWSPPRWPRRVRHDRRTSGAGAVRDSPAGHRRGKTRWRGSRHQPIDTHVLADPGHAWQYGTSVQGLGGTRCPARRVKDSALAIYSRDVAVRVRRTDARDRLTSTSSPPTPRAELAAALRPRLPGHGKRPSAARLVPERAVQDLRAKDQDRDRTTDRPDRGTKAGPADRAPSTKDSEQ